MIEIRLSFLNFELSCVLKVVVSVAKLVEKITSSRLDDWPMPGGRMKGIEAQRMT
jgi:hypothetical protein